MLKVKIAVRGKTLIRSSRYINYSADVARLKTIEPTLEIREFSLLLESSVRNTGLNTRNETVSTGIPSTGCGFAIELYLG
jgi:hypothetical protein